MKAWLLEKPQTFTLLDLPLPEDEQKVIIQVKAIGICGSELSAYKGIFPLGTYPRTLGHEISGEVVSAPENDREISVGDKVVLEPYKFCGQCYPCSQGRTNCCDHLKVISVHENGAHMEFYAHDLNLVHKVPNELAWEHAAMAEPLTISIHGVHRAKVHEGEHVIVIGAGAIGLLAAQYIKYLKAIPVVLDVQDKRLEIARQLGIDYVINPSVTNATEEIREITKGRMAEAVIEASGSQVAIRSSLDYVSNAGRISLVGYPNNDTPLPTFLFTKKELDVMGSRNSAEEFPLAIRLIADGSVNLAPFITNIISFEEIPEYFVKLTEHPSDYLKVIAKL